VTLADAWLAGFAALFVVCAATVFLRKEPTLVRGSTVFLLIVLYVALGWGVLAWRGGTVPSRALIGGLVALGASALLTPWWFVLGGPRAAVISPIEVCFGRVCAQYRASGSGFVMTVPGGDLHVRLHAVPSSRMTVLSLRARPSHRKSDLFRRLLIKQYRGMFPVIRIRMG
jgi:hypothetical protein